MKKCVIIGGASIRDYPFVKSYIEDDDFIIYCDCGLKHMEKLGLQPNLIVGDFDSYPKPQDITAEIITLPTQKDDTDTAYAVKEAIKRGYDSFIFLGFVGNRFDHSLANTYLLLFLYQKGKEAIVLYDNSLLKIVGNKTVYIKDDCKYFSLININGLSKGINISGAKYPLVNAEIEQTFQYGISNEVIKGKIAQVSVKFGLLLLVIVYKE